MKINPSISFLFASIALISTTGQAQTTPAGTATPTTYPIGAIATDSTPASGSQRMKKSAKRNRTQSNTNAMPANSSGSATGSTTNGGSQDAKYRQGSTSNGTSVNNSNTTNYDVNNAITAPTGAGSNSSSTGNPPATPPNNNQSSSMSGTNTTSAASAAADNASTGTSRAVTGARTTEEPAVKAGSTDRNASVGDFIASSPNYTTLQNALQSVSLDKALMGGQSYTIFAPTNSAFKKLPADIQRTLLEGRNRESLTKLLTYHAVSGSMNMAELTRQAKAGKAQLKTLSGDMLTANIDSNGHLTLTDGQGNAVRVNEAEKSQSNGIVYSVDSVLLPKAGTADFH